MRVCVCAYEKGTSEKLSQMQQQQQQKQQPQELQLQRHTR